MGDFDVFCIEDGYCSPANIVQSIYLYLLCREVSEQCRKFNRPLPEIATASISAEVWTNEINCRWMITGLSPVSACSFLLLRVLLLYTVSTYLGRRQVGSRELSSRAECLVPGETTGVLCCVPVAPQVSSSASNQKDSVPECTVFWSRT